GSAPRSVKVDSGVSLSFASLPRRRFAPPLGSLRVGDIPPPNSTLTSHTPLLLARPRQKALHEAQRLLLNQGRKKMNDTDTTTFSLGAVVATPGAVAAFEEACESFLGYLMRHASRDWGEIPP